MEKTALQQLIEWGDQMIKENPGKILSFHEAIDKAEELLELEKEQIIDALEFSIEMIGWDSEGYYEYHYGDKNKVSKSSKQFLSPHVKNKS